MKLIFAVLDVSSTVGLTRCYKTKGFYAFIKVIKHKSKIAKLRATTATQIRR